MELHHKCLQYVSGHGANNGKFFAANSLENTALRTCTSGTENDISKRPRKTWYLYHSLLFLAPHIAHRSTSSNFVRRNIIITQSSPSTTQSAPQTLQSAS